MILIYDQAMGDAMPGGITGSTCMQVSPTEETARSRLLNDVPAMAESLAFGRSERDDHPIIRAHANLVAGCDFVARRQFRISLNCSWSRRVHDRLLANHLRELDRFLCVLLEEAALLLGGPDHDAPGFAQLRKTSRKLHLVEQMTGRAGGHAVRLAAIRRVALHLRQYDKPFARCHGRDIVLACGSRQGTPLSLQPIARFYHDLGNDLMRDIQILILDFSCRHPYISNANVACDGI